MSSKKAIAFRVRRLILIAGMLYSAAALAWVVLPFFNKDYCGLMGTPLGLVEPGKRGYAMLVAGIVGIILLLQWVFLRPRRDRVVWLACEGRPLRSSVIVAGLMAAFLSVGVASFLLELPDWWDPAMEKVGIWIWAVIGGLWAGWATVFFVYWRQGDHYTQLGRMIRALVAGSLLEGFVAVPAHVWATRQRECYCMRGTYTTLVFAGIVLLWAFGPGVLLLFLRERYRRERLFPSCVGCGYSLRGLPLSSLRCPECGRPFDDRVRSILAQDDSKPC